MTLPRNVSLFEAGARDGLQNEAQDVPTAVRVELIQRLARTGLTRIEAGSFVSPKWVPKMADTAEVHASLEHGAGVTYPVLTPNMKGLEGALACGAKEIGVFGAASEGFTKANTNCTIAESMARARPVAEAALAQGVAVRGYISVAMGCPFDGETAPEMVADLARELHGMGCYEISLGDTIGVGTPGKARAMIEACAKEVPLQALALHFHDTYGQALANLAAVLDCGLAVIDSSLGGLGGCPYAKGAKGNVATEDVLYMLAGMGIETGVDLEAVTRTSWWLFGTLGRRPNSRVAQALGAKLGLAA